MAVGRAVVLFTTAALASLALAPQASAETFVVTKLGDPQPNGCRGSDCSLREAVIAANNRAGADRIQLPKAKTYRLAIENSVPEGEDAAAEGDLDITGPLRVSHSGKGKATVNAKQVDRVFDVFAPARFSNLVITNGFVVGEGFGGGIRAEAKVGIRSSAVIRNRTAEDDGGGIGFSEPQGSLTVIRSRISRNVSDDDGGGVSFGDSGPGFFRVVRSSFIGNRSADWGGGFITAKTANIKNSTFANNVSEDGNGGGGSIEGPDNNVVTNSTFSGNRANSGGGLGVSDGSDARLVNVTVADNTGQDDGGGLWLVGDAANLNAVTVVRNDADSGGGVYGDSAEDVRVENSLIALNGAQTSGADCFGDLPFDSRGHNLLSTEQDCSGFDAQGDLVRAQPKVGRLSRNGGPTKTVPLKAGSPAIGAADRQSSPGKDQRGRKRDRHPDIGAFER